ncbi:MAG: prepilin peptidase [Treponema sp.]|uniref:hypothetical protein n=1 Tax=Treponema sp. TaxID=166 RepID=UPI0025F241F3|nr:hypothetical protein [Treponema sp.]MBQ8679647.1 prepilin peptidase [Treponema sp.]
MDKTLLVLTALYLLFAIPLSLMDFKKFRISIPLLLFASLSLLVCRFVFLSMPLLSGAKNLFFALISSFLIYFCTRVLSGEGLGFGDVFFGMYSALYTGFYLNIICTVFAALLGVLYYLLLAILQKMKKKQLVHRPIFAIPFVPFITAGSVLGVLLFYVIA